MYTRCGDLNELRTGHVHCLNLQVLKIAVTQYTRGKVGSLCERQRAALKAEYPMRVLILCRLPFVILRTP